jgi:hypothetical protein
MRTILMRVHGVIAYPTAGPLLAAPSLLRLKDKLREVVRTAGAGAADYGMIPDFALGAVKVLPIPAYLVPDAASGPRYRPPRALVGGERDPGRRGQREATVRRLTRRGDPAG